MSGASVDDISDLPLTLSLWTLDVIHDTVGLPLYTRSDIDDCIRSGT